MKACQRAATAAAVAAAVFAHGNASAAGFALIEHSAQGMGNAFAGGGAAATDASAVWFNPAGMAVMPQGAVAQATAHVIAPSFDFTDGGSVQALSATSSTPLLPGSRSSDDGGETKFVANLYYKRDVSEKLMFGLGVNTPFGLATKYSGDWIGRYQAIESEIKSVNINPSIAFKATEEFSVGFGVSAMYMDAVLTNAIDFNAVCAFTVGPAVAAGAGVPAAAIPAAVAGACSPSGTPGSGGRDGFVKNKANGWGYGFNVGAMYQASEDTRVSVAYRSKVSQKLKGSARFSVPTGIAVGPLGTAPTGINAQIGAAFADDRITAKVKLPDTLSFSAWHRLNEQWEIMGDATWTGWSSVPELRIVFDRPTTAGGPGVETLDWDDTWRLAVGTAYSPNKQWTLRTGVAYDESPIPSATSRTARLPDNDRIWLSFGATYKASDALNVDVGYTHLFISDTRINRAGSTGNVLIGTYESDANLFSAQVRYNW